MHRLLIPLLLIGFSFPAFSQSDCQDKLIQAQSEYEEGKIQNAIELIKGCAQNGTVIDRWQANRLLAICYLVDVQTDEARKAAVEMLRLNPTYSPNQLYDPAEFKKLLETITVIPKFSLGMTVSAGSNLTFAEVDKSYVVGNYTKNYNANSGIQIGTCFGLYFSPHLQLSAIANVSNKNYSIDYRPDNWQVDVSEKQTYFNFALSQEYIFRPTQRLRPFVALGPNIGYLLYDRMTFSSQKIGVEEEKYALTKINVMDSREQWSFGLLSSAGLYYKKNKGIWNLRLDYLHTFNQVNLPDRRYSRLEQMYNFLYVDDDIKLHTLNLSFGYSLFINYRVYDEI